MGRQNNMKKEHDRYEDFINGIGEQFAGGREERLFVNGIAPEYSPDSDIQVNVGQRVKSVREEKGLSLEDISQRTDIDVPLLKEIESGETAPPLGTVIKLAKALDMKMGYFISGKEDRPYTIVRREDKKIVSRYGSDKGARYGYEYISLAPHKRDRHMEPFLVTLSPSSTDEERSTHDGQEFLFVLEGAMEVRLGEEIHMLNPGDSIYYDSTVPHLVKCGGSNEAKIIGVLYTEK